jgi:zinc and cadmium transporter
MTDSMISSGGLLAIYCVLVTLASLGGGWLLILMRPTHTRLQIATSFVAGLMLGISLLHFLPDAMDKLKDMDQVADWMLGGFLAMFFLQRFFHFHHHDTPLGDPEDCCQDEPAPAVSHSHAGCDHDHGHDHGHDHSHEPGYAEPLHAHTLADKSARQLSWVGTALGMTLHSLLDGLALAVSVMAADHGQARLAGLGVAMVIILHKPFDAMAVTTLMTVTGSSRRSRHVLNLLFALASPLGAGIYLLGASQVADSNTAFLGGSLALCAGTFLCIASSDLLPELQFHSHDRFKLSIALIAGLAVAIVIKQMGG